MRPWALIIDSTMPDAARDAGSNAILSHARSLIRLGYEVVFAPMDMAGAEALNRLGIVCCHAPWFAPVEEVLLYQAQCLALVYLHRVTCALPYMGLVRRHQPKAWVVYSVADLHHLRAGPAGYGRGPPGACWWHRRRTWCPCCYSWTPGSYAGSWVPDCRLS